MGILVSLAPMSLPSTAAFFSPLSVYGRLLFTTPLQKKAGLSQLISAILSIRLLKSHAFALFYSTGVCVNLCALYVAIATSASANAILCLCLFQLQVVRRLLEVCFVHRFSNAEMPLHLAAFGAAHYICTPWVFLPGFSHVSSSVKSSTSLSLMVLGVALFFFGSFIQHWAHRELAGLRRQQGKNDTTADYPLPTAMHSPVFLVSLCPHYTSEIVLYAGLLSVFCSGWGQKWNSPCSYFLIGFDLSSLAEMLAIALPWLMFGWVVSNLGATAYRLKQWYAKMYPGKGVEARFAILPPFL